MDGHRAIDDAGSIGSGAAVSIGVLGPMRLEVDGVERPLTAPRQRAVLACLVLHVGEAVSADRLLHDVWGDELPGSGAKAVAYQILQLRNRIGPAGGSVITTSPGGYRLDVDRDHIDLHAMDALIDRARAALADDPAGSEVLLERALGLSRGRPFADLDDTFLDVEVQRLEGRQVLARRTLAEARLAQGRASDVIGDLDVLLAEHPLDEAVAGVLMTALDGAGRTADALRVYGDLRRRLGSELGIEPSGQLRQLEQRLLTGGAGGERVASSGNLPTPLSSFVGREEEIAEITALLSSARLVSLSSFGGAGKTRLAIEVATRLRDRFADGAWFVDLVPISDPVLLPETFVAGIGIPETGARDTESYLAAQLATRHALIVVDNCEHLADAVGKLVGRLLRHAPDIRILATSRARLGVPDEVVWNVPPLPTATAAIELFVQRAELVRPGAGADADRRLVAQICERLDGIPLAIELASARLKIMTAEQIAEHLEDRFRLLVSTDRQADGRQRSLLATMTWSDDLLDDEERDLLRRMASCVDGFSLDAAIALSGRDRFDVVDRLERLVAAGLVTFTDRAAIGRYRMLETVRDFAAGRRDPGDDTAAAVAHATYYATIAADISRLRAAGSDEWIGLGDREIGNLRAAMGWAFANGNARLGMAMAHDLWHYFWTQASGSNENVRWGRLALDLIEDDDDDVVLVAAGTVIEAYNLGDVPALQLAADRVRRGLDAARPPAVISRLLVALATANIDTDPRAAEAYLDEAWSAAPMRPESIAILNNLIELSWLAGELHNDAVVLERLHAVLATSPGRARMARKVEAGVAASTGRWEDVLQHTEDLLGTDKVLIDLCLLRSEALGALGRHAEALSVAGDPDVNDYWADVQRVNLVCAAIELARGDPAAALDRLEVVVRSTEGDERRLALSMHVAALQAVAAHRLGDPDRAAMLFGFAAAERTRLGIVLRRAHRPLIDGTEAACRAALGDARFDQLAASGMATTWRDLLARVVVSRDGASRTTGPSRRARPGLDRGSHR